MPDWSVVWGAGAGFCQRRRRRPVAVSSHTVLSSPGGYAEKEGEDEEKALHTPAPCAAEDARLWVMGKEREVLAQMVGIGASARARR